MVHVDVCSVCIDSEGDSGGGNSARPARMREIWYLEQPDQHPQTRQLIKHTHTYMYMYTVYMYNDMLSGYCSFDL